MDRIPPFLLIVIGFATGAAMGTSLLIALPWQLALPATIGLIVALKIADARMMRS